MVPITNYYLYCPVVAHPVIWCQWAHGPLVRAAWAQHLCDDVNPKLWTTPLHHPRPYFSTVLLLLNTAKIQFPKPRRTFLIYFNLEGNAYFFLLTLLCWVRISSFSDCRPIDTVWSLLDSVVQWTEGSNTSGAEHGPNKVSTARLLRAFPGCQVHFWVNDQLGSLAGVVILSHFLCSFLSAHYPQKGQ